MKLLLIYFLYSFEVSGVLNYILRLKETGHRGLQQLPVGEGLGIFFFVAVLIYLLIFKDYFVFNYAHTQIPGGYVHLNARWPRGQKRCQVLELEL